MDTPICSMMVVTKRSHQAATIRHASRPVTLIHGPPGTGKTRTAAVVALTFASQNAQSSAETSDEAILWNNPKLGCI